LIRGRTIRERKRGNAHQRKLKGESDKIKRFSQPEIPSCKRQGRLTMKCGARGVTGKSTDKGKKSGRSRHNLTQIWAEGSSPVCNRAVHGAGERTDGQRRSHSACKFVGPMPRSGGAQMEPLCRKKCSRGP